MKEVFKDFDFSSFWDDSDYSLKEYVNDYPTNESITKAEKELGYKLPSSYIELMRVHNGGIPFNTCFPTKVRTSWAEDHIAITGIFGIGWMKNYSLLGPLGSKFMVQEWKYPDIGICICDCPSAGHDMIMLDYRKCGKNGEPEVVHVDQESDFRITFLAKDFDTFIRGLVNEERYSTADEDLKRDLSNIEIGMFSAVLSELVRKNTELEFEIIIRAVCKKLTMQKGYFAMHSDPLSYLVYDTLFYLYSKTHQVAGKEGYLKIYPSLIAFGDGEFTTKGYGPGFVEEWFNIRIDNKLIVSTLSKGLGFTDVYEKELIDKLLGHR